MNLSDTILKSCDQPFKSAILIDYPNAHISLKTAKWPTSFDYEVIEKFAKLHSEIVTSRIYGDWRDYPNEKRFLSQYDVELIQVSHVLVCGKRRKDMVDTKMSVDIGLIIPNYPDINLIILVTGDADFLPVVETIKQQGNIRVIIIAEKKSMSDYLGKAADGTLYYQYLAELD